MDAVDPADPAAPLDRTTAARSAAEAMRDLSPADRARLIEAGVADGTVARRKIIPGGAVPAITPAKGA